MAPYDISHADLFFTVSDIPVNEAESSAVIDDEVVCNSSIDCNESIHSHWEENRQCVSPTSTNILEVGAPYPRSRVQQLAIDYPIDTQIDNTIELSIVGHDSDRGQCNDTIGATPFRPSEAMLAGHHRRGISRPTPPAESKRDHISDSLTSPSPFAEQIPPHPSGYRGRCPPYFPLSFRRTNPPPSPLRI